MKILFATTEAVPFCKTGGLGDVCGSLPLELANMNFGRFGLEDPAGQRLGGTVMGRRSRASCRDADRRGDLG